MPLPKDLLRKLTSLLKEGSSLPDELDDLVVFPNEGAFLEAANKKNTAALKAAETEAAKKIREAKTAAHAEALKAIGVEDPEKLEEFKLKLAEAEGVLTESEKLKATITDLTKKLTKAGADNEGNLKTIADLNGFKVKVQKDGALAPHLPKIREDVRGIVAENLIGKLVIDKDGKITGPEGKEVAAFIDEVIKATPSLKAPDFKEGAGSGPGGGKTDPPGGKKTTEEPPVDTKPKTFAATFAAAAAQEYEKMQPAGGAGGP